MNRDNLFWLSLGMLLAAGVVAVALLASL